MSIVQALIGSIASSGSGGGGGGGGGGGTYPSPGSGTYQANLGGGFGNYGTAYDPGGAVDAIYSASSGWRRVTSLGYWCTPGSANNNNPGLFGSEFNAVVDAYGGFGTTEGADAFAMEWKGYFQASTAAAYWNFILDSDDVTMFWIGNAALNPTLENAYSISNNGTTYPTNSLLLTEGKYYPIRMRFQEWSGAERCQVYAAAEGGTAYSMLTYYNAARLIYSSYTNGYSSQGSPILNLGNATTNVYSGSGNWIDSSQALNNAQLYGSSTLPTWLPADSGGVFQLDGTNYFEVPNLRYYNDQEMTVSIWFNIPTDTSVAQTLISKELTFKIRINPGGALQVFAGNGGGWNISPVITGAYTYGEWTNITVTINSGNTYIYKNGQSIGFDTGAVLWSGDTQAFNIGTYSNGAGHFMTGKVGEVKYYTGFKSAQEVLDEYNATVERYIPPVRLTSGTALTFNGTDNRHLIVADNLADWNLGDNWTIEWWQKIPVGVDGYFSVLCQDANVPTYSGIDVFVNAGSIQMFNGGLTVSETPATRGVWNHIAIQKNGTTLAAYINGVSRTVSGSHSGTISPSSPLNVVIGSRTADGGANFYGQYFNGQLANIRISTIARYTVTFTPPTTVVTDQYTKLSLDGSSGGDGMLTDELARHTITNNGAVEDTIT